MAASLTKYQRERRLLAILDMMRRGLSRQEICAALALSSATVGALLEQAERFQARSVGTTDDLSVRVQNVLKNMGLRLPASKAELMAVRASLRKQPRFGWACWMEVNTWLGIEPEPPKPHCATCSCHHRPGAS